MVPAASFSSPVLPWGHGRMGRKELGETIAILGVGVALAGLILTSVRGLRQDMQAQ